MLQDDGELSSAPAHQNVAAFTVGYLLAGRYRIGDRIGKGGFGFVYTAEDLELEVTVAIKVLRPEIDGNHEMVRRFKQEIQLARQVTHENVCRIYDVGFYEFGSLRVPFLSMELLVGESLSERHKRLGFLPWRELKLITQQVALGLQAAHRVGIVHADLKPANIMLVGQGMETRAVVTDFGLASAHATDVEASSRAIVGTPAYMSPEQVQCVPLTPATDFYALGCTLFQMISGTLPFVASSVFATAKARLTEPPPKLQAASGAVPANWAALVRDLLILDPTSRIATAEQVHQRLRTSPRRWFFAGALAAVVSLGVLAVLLLRTPVETGPSGPLLFSMPQAVALERYNEGLRQWDALDGAAAVNTWKKAIEDGLGHPRTFHRLCVGLDFFLESDEAKICWRDAAAAASELPTDERDYFDARSLDRSGKLIQSAEILQRLNQRHPGTPEFVMGLADVQTRQRRFDEALQTLENAPLHGDVNRLAVEARIMSILLRQKKYPEIIARAGAPLDEAHRQNLARLEMSLLMSLSQSHRNLGNLKESRELGERRMKLAHDLGATLDEASAVSDLVAIAMHENRFRDAEELAERQTVMLADLKDQSLANQMSITKAEIFLVTGRPREADALLTQEALPRLRGTDDTYWEGYALLTRAEVRRSLGRGLEATEDCYAGEAIFRGLESQRLQAYAKMLCGHALIDIGRLDDAERELAEAYQTRKALNLDLQLLQNELSRAELAMARGEHQSAHEIAAVVAKRYDEKGLVSDEMATREVMVRAALAQDNLDLAIADFAPMEQFVRGENIEINLQIDLLAARIALRKSSDRATQKTLDGLLKTASDLGYQRLVKANRRAIEADQGQ